MDSLPAEILLEIGRTDLATYKGMLVIPKFARAVSIGYRLDMMVDTGYDFGPAKYLYKYEGVRIHRKKNNISYKLSFALGGRVSFEVKNYACASSYMYLSRGSVSNYLSISLNGGYRIFKSSNIKHVDELGYVTI